MTRCRHTIALALVVVAFVVGCSGGDHDDDGHGPTQSVHTQRDALAAAVRVEALGCSASGAAGAGSFIARERVITVAHVVAGSTSVEVVLADGRRVAAKVTGIDRAADLAILDVEEPTAPLATGRMPRRATGEFVVYREGEAVALPFRVLRYGDIQVPGYADDGPAHRHGYELQAEVAEGDSGSVLVADGVATALMFARSADNRERAWAVDISEAAPLLAADNDEAVDTGACWP
ncbi:MAG: serine protease [Actinomycetota bacterium]|nr:serine protease [Actinomycetota bacterium]